MSETNKNNLEKIIKLDKKNGNFDIYDKYAKYNIQSQCKRRKLKIRTSQPFTNYQSEYTLCYFWRHINQIYFKKIDNQELERLEYVKSSVYEPLHTDFPLKYADPISYNSRSILSSYLKQDPLYYEVLLKHIYLSTAILNNKQHAPLYQLKQKAVKKNLSQESQAIDKLIAKTNEGQSFEIYNQIQELEEELQKLNKQNKKELSELQHEISLPETTFSINKFVQNKKGKRFSNEALLTYLRQTLKQLDYRQTAESITKVISSIHTSSGYGYVVAFESGLNQNFGTMDEPLMMELDKLRDTSLFKFYNIPQKTKYSHIAQNSLAIKQVTHNRSKPNPYANKNMQKDIKSILFYGQEADQSKFESCHHCKMLFRDEYLIACNYRSGTMGLPLINQTITDSYLFTQYDEEGIKSRRQVPNRKKTQYSTYTKRNGELVCNRKFCRLCLKQNYENSQNETSNKNDWVCPFCQATCFCSRCQRNDIMIKLRDLYTLCGGDIDELSKDSVFEKYVKAQQDDQNYKRKQSPMKKRNGFNVIRQQLNSFKQMQTVRLDFENLRLLCSQVVKREKLKLKLIQYHQSLWELKQVESVPKIVQKQQKQEKKMKVQIQQQEQEIEQSSSESEYEESEHSEQNEVLQEKRKYIKRDRRPYSHIVNNFKSFPSKNIKREVVQLLQQQDSDTYSLVVKKIKEDNKQNGRK
ncbi:hypothetical protein pb186bvf_003105 [Paramecium bursaria]